MPYHKIYNPKTIEKKWQKKWEEDQTYKTEDPISKKKKFYTLIEFPYPSGAGLHVGHVKGQTAVDVFARYKRMQGYNVLNPMGYDSFGLPAENFAIKNHKHPKPFTDKNVKNFIKQQKSFGPSFDWSRRVDTTDPDYYKWTQWIFLQLFKQGLAYEKEAPINWCPSCKTGLANEEVIKGKCERCDSEVEKKNMKQWFLKITAYADRLIDDLKDLDWPEHIKTSQKNWIGKKDGIDITYEVGSTKEKITCFTTRPDTNFGATFVVLAPEHDFVNKIIKKEIEVNDSTYEGVQKYVDTALAKSELERQAEEKKKTGVFTGFYAINNLNNKKLPIWISDFVLGDFGTGAVVGVPGHDKRDFQFATAFDLDVVRVVVGQDGDESDITKEEQVQEEEGKMVHSDFLDGMDIHKATKKVMDYLEDKGWGKRRSTYHLRDWLFSRQRYWGEPIPVIKCKHCGLKKKQIKIDLNFYEQEIWDLVMKGEKDIETRALNPEEPDRYFGDVADGDLLKINNKKTGDYEVLQVKQVFKFKCLADLFKKKELLQRIFGDKDFQSLSDLEKAYAFTDDYVEKINKNGLVAWEFEKVDITSNISVAEKDLPILLPEVENYEPTGTGESPLAHVDEWVNVDCPKCGGKAKRETNTMPQWAGSSWYFLRFADPHNDKEYASQKNLKYYTPVDIYFGGAEHTTLHLLYSRFWMKALYDLKHVPYLEPFTRRVQHGMILGPDNRKMSKRWGNIIDPLDVIKRYGADTMRTYIMFMGPYADYAAWSVEAIEGMNRFMKKIWNLGHTKVRTSGSDLSVDSNTISIMHQSIKKVTDDIEKVSYHTAIAQMMIMANHLTSLKEIDQEVWATFLKLLSPFAPHITEELWSHLGKGDSIHLQKWPEFDKDQVRQESIELVIQINGKVRDKIQVGRSEITEEEANQLAMNSDKVKQYIEGKTIRKAIFVKGRLLNIVV